MKLGDTLPCNRFARVLVLAIMMLFAVRPATHAMIINITFDSSITSLGNAAQVEAAINLAAQVYEALYTNNITVNITAYFASVDLGQSLVSETGNPTYAEITNYLRATRTTFADSNSVASLPASDPAAGINVWWLPWAEARNFAAVGLYAYGVVANDGTQDGSVYFSDTEPYALNPTNRAVPGESDLTSVAEHEISEVLGRGLGLNITNTPVTNGFVPFDLFRFTNSAAHMFRTNALNAYFSADNGVTPLAFFNPDPTAGDLQDWKVHSPADSFDYSLTQGQEGYLSYADLTALDVLGYNLNFHPPKLAAARGATGKVQLTFTNVTGLNFSIIASTNLTTAVTNWVNLGMPIETSVGKYQFNDSITNKTRYYRARLN
jgi:hypothetical protein